MKSSYFIVLAIAIIALISVEFIIETTEIGNLHAELEASQRHSAAPPIRFGAWHRGWENMMAIQQHHAKLWFAGVNGNWGLASYELGELDELFADVIQYYPMHDSIMLAPVYTRSARSSLRRWIPLLRDAGRVIRSRPRLSP